MKEEGKKEMPQKTDLATPFRDTKDTT